MTLISKEELLRLRQIEDASKALVLSIKEIFSEHPNLPGFAHLEALLERELVLKLACYDSAGGRRISIQCSEASYVGKRFNLSEGEGSILIEWDQKGHSVFAELNGTASATIPSSNANLGRAGKALFKNLPVMRSTRLQANVIESGLVGLIPDNPVPPKTYRRAESAKFSL